MILHNPTTTFQMSLATFIVCVKLLTSKRKQTIIVDTVNRFKAKVKNSWFNCFLVEQIINDNKVNILKNMNCVVIKTVLE